MGHECRDSEYAQPMLDVASNQPSFAGHSHSGKSTQCRYLHTTLHCKKRVTIRLLRDFILCEQRLPNATQESAARLCATSQALLGE